MLQGVKLLFITYNSDTWCNFHYLMLSIVVEHVRLGPQGNRPVKVTKPKVFITTGADVPLKGMCLMFNRVRPQNEVTEENISQVTNTYGLFTLSKSRSER